MKNDQSGKVVRAILFRVGEIRSDGTVFTEEALKNMAVKDNNLKYEHGSLVAEILVEADEK